MAARNVKRGFHRLFFVVTVVWLLYSAAAEPFLDVTEHTNRNWDTSMLEERVCREKAMDIYRNSAYRDEGTYLANLDTCAEAGISAWREREKYNSLTHLYQAQWFWILLRSVLPPLVLYGTIRGIAAAWLWVWHGFREP